jgi:hypothetical protein
MVLIDLINAVLVAEYFIKYIFKLHRLSNSIVFNCRSQFVLNFWQALYK